MENSEANTMPNNVTKFPTRKNQRPQPIAPDPTNVHELGMGDDVTPQELLAMLSRDPSLEGVVIIVPEQGDEPMEVLVAGEEMDNQSTNWLLDTAKAKILGLLE